MKLIPTIPHIMVESDGIKFWSRLIPMNHSTKKKVIYTPLKMKKHLLFLELLREMIYAHFFSSSAHYNLFVSFLVFLYFTQFKIKK